LEITTVSGPISRAKPSVAAVTRSALRYSADIEEPITRAAVPPSRSSPIATAASGQRSRMSSTYGTR
jgi:hypothetical protein